MKLSALIAKLDKIKNVCESDRDCETDPEVEFVLDAGAFALAAGASEFISDAEYFPYEPDPDTADGAPALGFVALT